MIIYIKDGEDINRALRRFKKKVEDNGILEDLRKKAAGVQRYKKKLEKEQLPKKLY